jgi:hypothetical protein
VTAPSHRHTPRSAAVLLTAALDHLDMVEPAAAREPIRMMFRAAIERCTLSPSLSGQPVIFVLELAQALVDEAGDRQTHQDPRGQS